jgi:hypothetical protein
VLRFLDRRDQRRIERRAGPKFLHVFARIVEQPFGGHVPFATRPLAELFEHRVEFFEQLLALLETLVQHLFQLLGLHRLREARQHARELRLRTLNLLQFHRQQLIAIRGRSAVRARGRAFSSFRLRLCSCFRFTPACHGFLRTVVLLMSYKRQHRPFPSAGQGELP